MKYTADQLVERLSGLADKIYEAEILVGQMKGPFESLSEQQKNYLATLKASYGDISDAKAETLARSSQEYKTFTEGSERAKCAYYEALAELNGLYSREKIFITLLSYEKALKII